MKIKMRNVLTALLTAGILAAAAMQTSAEGLEPVMETGDDTSTVEIVAEGTCGDNLTWVLDGEGTIAVLY